MLRTLDDLLDAAVIAKDGEIGKVRNFLFDDRTWIIRYLVVEIGNWLDRKEVVISMNAIDPPDWERKTLRTALTREQVRHSPDVDSQKPVSRQQEIAMGKYFGWPPYWKSTANPDFRTGSLPAGREYPVDPDQDPHLRSAESVRGYEIWADKTRIGRLEYFIVDEASWHIGYLDTKAGDWLHNRSMLVPTRSVESISWGEHRVKMSDTWKQT